MCNQRKYLYSMSEVTIKARVKNEKPYLINKKYEFIISNLNVVIFTINLIIVALQITRII